MDSVLFFNTFMVFFLVFLNGFFVAAEFSLVTVRKTRIDELLLEGNKAASYTKRAILDLDRYIAGTQIGITIASLALGWIGEDTVEKMVTGLFNLMQINISSNITHTISTIIAFTIVTFLHVILGELVPKSIAIQFSEKTALTIAKPMALVILILKPLIYSLNGTGQFILKMIGIKPRNDHGVTYSPSELISLIKESEKAEMLDQFEVSMLKKTFRFSETSVSEIMTPRSKVQCIDLNDKEEDIFSFVSSCKHTRYPVYSGDIDNITGVIYLQDLFTYQQQGLKGRLHEIIKPVMFIPEYIKLDSMIEKFQENKTQLSVIIDEYGGVSGIITLRDVIESVFGEIKDWHDAGKKEELKENINGDIVVRGDIRIDELNDRYEWSISNEEYDTIAGFLMDSLGKVPCKNDTLETEFATFIVTEMDNRQVAEVKIIKKEII